MNNMLTADGNDHDKWNPPHSIYSGSVSKGVFIATQLNSTELN